MAEARNELGESPVQSLLRPGGHRAAWPTRARWAIHLALLCSAAAALATLQLLHVRIAYHSVVGFAFVGLVLVHLAQRRQTIARMAAQVIRAKSFVERRIRLTVADVLLLVLTANVLVSGILDWSRGAPIALPLPVPFDRWHLDSGVVLVAYLTMHVWRRRKRLRRSTIR